MEALLRGAGQSQEQAEGSRQMSTTATAPASVTHPLPRPLARASPPTAVSRMPSLAPNGLPFYTHTETLASSGLPSVPLSSTHYFRYLKTPNAEEETNQAVSRMIDRLKSPPGSRWQGVVGFDMEWTVAYGRGTTKTGLIQVSGFTN
jgi:hypothetical protein